MQSLDLHGCPGGIFPDKGQKIGPAKNHFHVTLRKIFLQEKGIGTLIQWGGVPVHHFDGLGYGKEKYQDLSSTNQFFERCLMLPMNMSLTNDDVDYVIESITAFYLESTK